MATCPVTGLLRRSTCSNSIDLTQQPLLSGRVSSAGAQLEPVMHTLEAELQREIQQFAGAVVQRYKQTLLKELKSLSCKAAALSQPSCGNTDAATSSQRSCSDRLTTSAEGPTAASTAAHSPTSCFVAATAATLALCSSSSPLLPQTTSVSNQPHFVDYMAASGDLAAAAAAAVDVTCCHDHQSPDQADLGSSATCPMSNLARADLPAAAAAAVTSAVAATNIASSPFAQQCQQATVCQLLQLPEQQQQQQQELVPSPVQPEQQQQPQQQATAELPAFLAKLKHIPELPPCCCHHQQLPSSPAVVSQHSVAAAASDNAGVVNWQDEHLSDEEMQHLLDSIDSDAAAVMNQDPSSEDLFAAIDALMDDSVLSDFDESTPSLGLAFGPSAEIALLQISSLPQESQKQLEKLQQQVEAQQQQRQVEVQPQEQTVLNKQQLVPKQHLQHCPQQQQQQQQQQQNPYAMLSVDTTAAASVNSGFTSTAASSCTPLTTPHSNSTLQVPTPCSQPTWCRQQQQQQVLPQQWQQQQQQQHEVLPQQWQQLGWQQLRVMSAPTMSSCKNRRADDNIYTNDRVGSCRGRKKGRAAAAAAAAKIKLYTQHELEQQELEQQEEEDQWWQQHMAKRRKPDADAPLQRALSDSSCSFAAAGVRGSQWVRPQTLQQQWSMPAPCPQQQQQQQQPPSLPHCSVTLAAQLPSWLTRQVAITQSLTNSIA